MRVQPIPALLFSVLFSGMAQATPSFVNGLAISGATLGQNAEWRNYLGALGEKHQRKYKLMPLLKVL